MSARRRGFRGYRTSHRCAGDRAHASSPEGFEERLELRIAAGHGRPVVVDDASAALVEGFGESAKADVDDPRRRREQPADRRRRRRRRARWCVRAAAGLRRRGGSRRRCRRARRRRRAPTRRVCAPNDCGSCSVPQTDATTAMSRPSACSRARPSAITDASGPAGSAADAVAEHDVEEEDRVLRIGEHGRDALGPQRRIDHRMHPSAGVAIVSEVDHLVAARLHDVTVAVRRPRRWRR